MMRKLILFAAAVLAYVGTAFAQDLVAYQSRFTGVNIMMPADVRVIQDNEDELQLQTENIAFSSNPIMTETLTQEKLQQMMESVAKEVELTLAMMEMTSFETTTLKCVMFTGAVDGSTLFSIGYAEIKNNPAVGFLFTLTNTLEANKTATNVIKTYEFDPSALKE